VGAVVVKDKQVIGQGYNGVTSGKRHCIDGGCPRGQMDYSVVPPDADYNQFPCHAIHAEDNAIEVALEAFGKVALEGATIYVNHKPCQQCTNKIEKYRIGRVVVRGQEEA
jgi:dCMP deaminase